ncbi:hypothetical protein H257_01163 [Aphanomyces astaci]|uniref:SET domain-containing protein n=1 Tax=Aphanomyces astaci TaxID=112090 RepID=W4H712_APHAT|nr:hypothetical protein H257_01163 [Aphanomyces astaci]ETV87672.1 hypothetical protein H257_01163 [Aphanomyces astaci]|eukprot:XP_009822535.1 hypothetical protein H257_01163 [Aphanomyces astaci]
MVGHMEQSLVRILRGAKGSFISPKIQVKRFPSMGLGIQAVEPIDSGEVVFVASSDVWREYSAGTARAEARQQAPAFVERVDSYCGNNQRMADAVLLATHIVVGDASDVYLNSLPPVLDVPMYWTERRLDELRHCDVRHTIVNARQVYRKMHTDLFGSTAPMVSSIDFQWALSVLMSRATSGKDQPFTLIPYFEWFNHSHAKSACEHAYVEKDDSFVIRTTAPHAPNDQLYINYGDHHTPATYLRHYGFASIEHARVLDPVMMHDKVSFHDLPDSDGSKATKLRLLHALGWPVEKAKPFTVHMAGSTDQVDVWDWLRLYVATADELTHRQTHPSSVPWLESNSQRLQALVKQLCQARLAQYPSSPEDDFDLLRLHHATLEPWHAACVNVRLAEKLVLRSFLDQLDSRDAGSNMFRA